MSESTARLLPRGKTLLIAIGSEKPQNIVSFLDNSLDKNPDTKGITVEVQQVTGQSGNFVVQISSDSWKNTTSFQRMEAMTTVYKSLRDAGIPESIDDQPLLNAVHSGAARDGDKGRVARLAVFINASLIEKTSHSSERVVERVVHDPNSDASAQLEALTMQFLELGGDITTLPSNLSPVIQTGWLKAKIKAAGGTVPTTTATPTKPTTPTEGGDNEPVM